MTATKLLQVRMTYKEFEELHALAKKYDLDVSKFVRMIIRKAKKQDLDVGELKSMPEEID